MRWIAIAAGCISLILPGTGHADPELGGVVVSGKVEPHDHAVAAGAVEGYVRGAGWSLVTKPFTPREVDAIMACFLTAEAWPCVAKTVSDRGVRRLAAVTLTPQTSSDGGRQITISERLVLANAESLLVGQRFCLHCTDDTLAGLASELTKELLDRAALRSGRTVLSVMSTPQRAKYSVDGSSTGFTDAMIDVVPGKHVVTIEHDGFESVTQTVEAAEGQTREISVTLVRLDPNRDHAPPSPGLVGRGGPNDRLVTTTHRSRAVPVSLLVAGGVTVVGGVVVFGFNQKSTTKPRGEEQPRGYYDTVPAGIALVASGTVIAAIGGYLWWRYSQPGTSSVPMVAPVAGGAVLGVRTAF